MKPTILDPQYELYQGDCRDILSAMPEYSVDAILTSPPYWGLRSYKADSLVWDDSNGCCHEWDEKHHIDKRGKEGTGLSGRDPYKGGESRLNYREGFCLKCGAWRGQLGSEPDPDLFIKHLCDIFDLCKRVLKKTGSLWCNLDDSFAGSGQGGGGGSISNDRAEFGIQRREPPKNIPAKSLCAIPERFVLQMLRRGWIYRQTIIWQKPSCMPESVKDRFTRDFEYLYHFTQQQKYFFERQFEPIKPESLEREQFGWNGAFRSRYQNGKEKREACFDQSFTNPLGRNKRSVWSINPSPQKAVKKGAVAHYAAFPTALATIPILSTVPEQVCTKCGMPRVKIYEETPMQIKRSNYAEESGIRIMSSGTMIAPNEVKEVGLSDCGCGAPFVPGIILDPFAGTGTVAVEARKLGRKAVLIEVSEQYNRIIRSRLEKIPLPLVR